MPANPYIEALPPLRSLTERAAIISRIPHFDPAERCLRHVERRYALMRLFTFFNPAMRHLRISEGIDLLVRAGYEARNPADGAFAPRARNVARRIREAPQLFRQPVNEMAPAFTAALIGAPGLGKTRTVELSLAEYKQVVHHPGLPVQVVWLKLECPKRGSLRSLCIQFFIKMSAVTGVDYVDLYVSAKASETDLQNMMALVASLHGLGLLVIDEIQHVGRSADGENELMTFVTGLSNQLGIPVMIIGTLSVLTRVEETCRMARRAVGPASEVWHPLQMQSEWHKLFDVLWGYQWTCRYTEPTPELRLAFFECTGGILDLLVKLFLSVQLRLLYRSELRGNDDEAISEDFVRGVAEIDFRPIKYMVEALLSADEKQIMRFDDLHSFDVSFRQALTQLIDQNLGARLTTSIETATEKGVIQVPQGDQYQAIWSKLRAEGLGDDLILRLIDAARAEGLDAQQDPFGFFERVIKLKSKVKRQRRDERELKLASLDAHDLRRLVPEAAERGLTPLEALRQAGLAGIWPEQRAA